MRFTLAALIAFALPAVALGQTVPPVVAPLPSAPDTPRAELLRQAREAKADAAHPYQPRPIEKWIARVEPFLMAAPVEDGSFHRGFYPKLGGVTSGSGYAAGPGYRYEGLAGGRVDVDTFARLSWKKYWEVEGRVEMPRLNDDQTGVGLFVRVRDLPQEDFYGFGPASNRIDRVSFGLREFVSGAFASHVIGPVSLTGGVEFVRPRTRAGSDSNYPSIEQRFPLETLPAFVSESNFIVARGGARFDRTDVPGNPRRGPQYVVDVSHWRSRDGAPADFNRVDADLRHYIPFFNDTRVFVLRGALWHTDAAGSGDVPLYYQPTLGGSHALRGYREFRFRDRSALVLQTEYRFEIVPGADGAVFYEAGTVGPSLSDLGSLHTDYGFGLRFGTRGSVLLRIEAAFGTPESPRFYVKLSDAF